jgi:hypothetical protein
MLSFSVVPAAGLVHLSVTQFSLKAQMKHRLVAVPTL